MKRPSWLFALSSLLAGCSSAPELPAGYPPRVDTGIDSEAWARVPAGKFLAGQFSHEVLLDHESEIMVTDVTNAQYAAFLNQALAAGEVLLEGRRVVGYYPGDEFHGGKHEQPINAGNWLLVPMDEPGLRLVFDGSAFAPAAGYENHPMVQVTWFGARAYCKFYGWRLPIELEWEKAARGTDGRPYPWGEGIQPALANYYHSHDPFEPDPQRTGDTTPVGFYNGSTYDGFTTRPSASPYGLYDMAGNVWQWTADVFEGSHYRALRGGSLADYDYNLRLWTRNSAGPDYHSPSVGFRCARDAQP
ncbi:MAG: SUMF1/EgtB/PvdO family nonheme iron enzyme [Chloroflexota bacterium]